MLLFLENVSKISIFLVVVGGVGFYISIEGGTNIYMDPSPLWEFLIPTTNLLCHECRLKLKKSST